MGSIGSRLESGLDGIIAKIGLSGVALKLIASVIMVIDHAAVAVLNPYIEVNVGNMSFETFKSMNDLYGIMHNKIGRIAFPIFCFLLVEGFLHTKNVWKYARNLLIFAFISEVFFDLALFRNPFDLKHQNVYFTLLLGLICMYLLQSVMERRFSFLKGFHPVMIYALSILAVGLCMGIAYLLRTDYSYKGVLAISLMYLFRKNRFAKCVIGEIPFEYEPFAFFSIIPLLLYNNSRGRLGHKGFKYAFYAFYPAHLFILYLISYALGCR
ncbi:MAG: conjugal transfer protein TraX [Lachnospiraceae bacterium]|nr:conjugal transfer protein TraX [Lachnospiraceae bacterium]